MAAAICTSGPGATNFVTGMYTAHIDSIPLIAITGQNVSSLLGKDAFQCVDIAEICNLLPKQHGALPMPKISGIMRKAFQTARSGKPGPVLIDLPLDVQMADIDYDPEKDASLPIPTVEPEIEDIRKALDILEEAQNPVIIMGGGVILADAVKECIEFAEYMQIPVITTYMAKGGIPVDHPLNAGHMGIQVGAPLSNKIFRNPMLF